MMAITTRSSISVKPRARRADHGEISQGYGESGLRDRHDFSLKTTAIAR